MNRISVLQRQLAPSPTAAKSPSPTAIGPLQYTVGGGPLSHEQRLFYEENGYLVIRGLFKSEDLDTYAQRFRDICEGRVERSGTMLIMRDITLAKSGVLPKGESDVTKVQSFELDDGLFAYCRHPDILNVISSFVGPNITAMHTMLINKPPDTGKGSSRHPLHQDQYYFPFQSADRIVCSWTAMQTINRANGCLVVIPGTHKLPIREHGFPKGWETVNLLYHGIQDLDEREVGQRVHLEMEKGDTVFFHPHLIHGSGTNTTKGFRKSISCHYASSDCHYIDVTGTIQEPIKIEVEELAMKRGIELDVRDVWKGRARLCAGRPGPINVM